jgi:hypothetical protein
MNSKEIELGVREEIHISKETEQKFQEKHIGSIHPHRGHSLFEINLETGTIEPAECTKTDYVVNKDSSGSTNKKVVMKPDCVYISALNKDNALKKLAKRDHGGRFK